MLVWERYRKAQIVGRSKIDVWIQNWELSLKEAQKKNLGEVRDDINPAFDFLAAVESIASGFSDLWWDNNTPTLQGKTPPGTEKKYVCGAVQTKEHH